MKAIILAAGRSRRMEPVRDKLLLPLCGKPFVRHVCERVVASGAIDELIIATNPENKPELKEVFSGFSVPVKVIEQQKLDDGMAGAVRDGLEYIKEDEPVMVVNGNDLIDAQAYTALVEKLSEADGVILAKQVEKYFPGGYLLVDKDSGKITRIVEKPGEGNEPSNLVNIVAHAFARSGDLQQALHTAASDKDDLYEVALQQLLEEKHIIAHTYTGDWQPLKYPWHVLSVMEKILSQQESYTHPSATVHPSAVLRGGHIYISENAQVQENAVIVGPCYLGEGSIAGVGAFVRGSHLGEKCVAGYNTEIARSYLRGHIDTHMTYIGDSVVEEEVNFGAYSCTANLRLDKGDVSVRIKEEKINTGRMKLGAIVGKDAQIGIHACLMPGKIVPEGAFIPPGEVYFGEH